MPLFPWLQNEGDSSHPVHPERDGELGAGARTEPVPALTAMKLTLLQKSRGPSHLASKLLCHPRHGEQGSHLPAPRQGCSEENPRPGMRHDGSPPRKRDYPLPEFEARGLTYLVLHPSILSTIIQIGLHHGATGETKGSQS